MNIPSINDQIRALREAKAQRKAVELQEKELIKELRKQQKQKVDKVSIADLVTLLASSTQAVLDAAKDYQEKGFSVKIETDEKTGLITKWKLLGKRPKLIGTGRSSDSVIIPQLELTDFNSIFPFLKNEFNSKDIRQLLIEKGFGERVLQPILSQILNDSTGQKLFSKVEGTNKAGTRYRKV